MTCCFVTSPPLTRSAYLRHVSRLARHCGRSPDLLGFEEVREYLIYLADVRRISPSTFNQVVADFIAKKSTW